MEIRRFNSLRPVVALPGWKRLADAYASESGNAALGEANPKQKLYDALEALGLLRCVALMDGDGIVGLLVLVLQDHPHYSKPIAHVDAIFLDKDRRRGAAGLRLVRLAIEIAREEGAVGCYFSAPDGSRLERLYERLFKPTDRIFWAPCEVENGD